MSSNKQELCSEATSYKNVTQKYFYYRDKKRCIRKRQNKVGSHTDKNNNQLELDIEITCNTYYHMTSRLGVK